MRKEIVRVKSKLDPVFRKQAVSIYLNGTGLLCLNQTESAFDAVNGKVKVYQLWENKSVPP